MRRLLDFDKAGRITIYAIVLIIFVFFMNPKTSAQGGQARNLDIYPDYNSFLPAPTEGAKISFINRSSSGLKNFPRLMGPPQCPHESYRKGLKFPVLGKMDLTLFCAPGDRHKE